MSQVKIRSRKTVRLYQACDLRRVAIVEARINRQSGFLVNNLAIFRRTAIAQYSPR
jgi:hypothetical protein